MTLNHDGVGGDWQALVVQPSLRPARVDAKRLPCNDISLSDPKFDRSSLSLALLAVNVADFVRVNDRFGHDRGDELLAEIELAIEEAFPSVPLLRFGADRYAAIVESVARDDVRDLERHLKRRIGAPIEEAGAWFVVAGLELTITGAWSPAVDLALMVAEVDRALSLRLGSPEPLIWRVDDCKELRGRPREIT